MPHALEPRGDLALQRAPARRAPSVDAEPQHARRAARRKHADAAERQVERRRSTSAAPSPRQSAATRRSSTSPRNTSVRCSCVGRHPLQRRLRSRERRAIAAARAAIASRAASDRSTATNSRIARAQRSARARLRRRVLRLRQPCSMSRSMFSAACAAWNFTMLAAADELKRPDARRRRSSTTAIATVPTGFSGVPPPGPGDARDADADVRSGARADALRHRRATGSLTAPCSAISGSGTPSQLGLRAVAVAHDAAVDVVGAAGHVGQPRRQQPAGARLGDGDRQLALAQQVADDRFERPAVGAVDGAAEHVCELAAPRRRAPRRRRARLGASRGQVQLDLAEHRENRRADRHRLRASTARRPAARCASTSRLGPAGDLQHAPEQAARRPRAAPAARRSPPRASASSRAAGPAAARSHVPPCSIHRPGAVPLRVLEHVAPRGTIACRRLISGIVMPRRANRSRMRSTIASSTSSGTLEHARDRVARDVVLGRAEPAGADDQIGPVERALEQPRPARRRRRRRPPSAGRRSRSRSAAR